MKHMVSMELGLALDFLIEKFSIDGVLDAPRQYGNPAEPLNDIGKLQIAKYLIEGYEYEIPKSIEESIELFVVWLKEYNTNIPYPTKNSSYRRGRRHVLEEIEKKLMELNIVINIEK